MDTNTIFTLIGSLGFPIVMCFMLFKDQKESRDSHAKEIDKLSSVIEANTEAIITLTERVGRDSE